MNEEEEIEKKEEVDEDEVDLEQIDEEKKISTEDLESLVESKDVTSIRHIFVTVPDVEIAEAANNLEVKDLIFIFRCVETKYTAELFEELNQEAKENLVKALTDKELVKIITEQSVDDIADFIGEMPANLAQKVLKAADKDMRKDINLLLNYKEDTAGSLMTTEYLEFLDTAKVEATMKNIREKGKDAETIYTIFVRDKNRDFVGTVDLDDLIFADPEQTLSEIMNQDVVSCNTYTDQEEAAQLFRRYGLSALAVLNDDGKLVGIITIDDAVDVMTEESSEDFARISKMEPTEKPYMELSAWENAKKCIPWLAVLIVLGTFTTMVLNRLESQKIFRSLPILIAFIPALMDTAGNAGGQTSGLMIRGLALKEFGPKQVLKVLWKEIRSGVLVALVIAAFVFLWLGIEQYTGIVDLGGKFSNMNIWKGNCWNTEFALHVLKNAGLVSSTMLLAVIISKTIGTLLPMGAAAIKKDPALLSQPLITTIMDVLVLVTYFLVACLFFPHFA